MNQQIKTITLWICILLFLVGTFFLFVPQKTSILPLPESTEQVCTKELQITPSLLSVLKIKNPERIQNLHPCLIAEEIRKKNNFFLPEEALTNLIRKNCQPSKDMIYIFEDKKHPVPYYKTKDGSHFCKTVNSCANIIIHKKNYLVLLWNEKWVSFLYEEEPLVFHPTTDEKHIAQARKLLDSHFHTPNLSQNTELAFLNGWLGNQLFQYWSAKVSTLRNNQKLYTHGVKEQYVFKVFDLKPVEATSESPIYSNQSAFVKRFYSNNSAWKNQYLPTNKKWVYITGFLQSHRNLTGYEDYIRKHTVFREPLSEKNQQIADKMKKEESVAIHVRRGDYHYLGYYILTPEYYQHTINIMNKQLKNPHYYIFSNDLPWAKENLKIKEPHTFVDWNKKDYEDLHLMSQCNHFIIGNSTFSWWGAFLGKNPNKIVIAPEHWMSWAPQWGKEMIPPEWIGIDNRLFSDNKQ